MILKISVYHVLPIVNFGNKKQDSQQNLKLYLEIVMTEFKLSTQFISVYFLYPKFWSSKFNLELFSQV